MAEKLTTQLSATNKKVDDVSKARLGSGYKDIIKLPGLEDSDIYVDVTDIVTTVLSNISPTGYANEHIVSTETEFNLGTGDYEVCEFNFCVATADLCNQWYYYDIPESMVNKTVVIKISSPPSSAVSYNDTKVGKLGPFSYVASNGRHYSRLEKIARDINLSDSPAVNVIIRPTSAGRYFIGMQSPTNNTTSSTLTWAYDIITPQHWTTTTRGAKFIYDGNWSMAYNQGISIDIEDTYYSWASDIAGATRVVDYLGNGAYIRIPTDISTTGTMEVHFDFKNVITGAFVETITRTLVAGVNSYTDKALYFLDGDFSWGSPTYYNTRCYRIRVTGITPAENNRVLMSVGKYHQYAIIPADDTGAAYGKRFYFKGDYFISPLGAPTATANGSAATVTNVWGAVYTVSGSAPWVFSMPVMTIEAIYRYVGGYGSGHQLFDAEGSLDGTDFWIPLPRHGANVTTSTSTIMVIPVVKEELSCTYTTSTGVNKTIIIPAGGANIKFTNTVGEMFAHLTFTKAVRAVITYGGSGGEFVLPANIGIPNTRYVNYATMQADYLDMSPRSDDDTTWERVLTLGTTYGDVGALSWTVTTFPQTVDNLVAHVAMSTDGTNFGPWVGVYNGGNFPSTPGATHVKVRLTAPLDTNAVNTQSHDDNWVSEVKILYYTYTEQ